MNRRFAWVFIVSICGSLLGSSNCHAGRLCDWLFRRNRPQPVTAFYPGTAPAGCCGPGSCQQTVVRYVPQVAYRTVWQPVPVTTYRRTTFCNPQSGLPITCTRPCTTYTYQARRVPYTSYRPVYVQVPVTDTFMPAAPVGCSGCSTGFASAAPTTSSPSYSSPTYSTPDSGATPWRRVPDSQEQGSNSGNNSDYGDRIPRIQPPADKGNEGAQPQGAMPRRLSRMPSTRSAYVNQESYYRSRTADRDPTSDSTRTMRSSDPNANAESYLGQERDSSDDQSIVRHRTLDREALKPLEQSDRNDRFRKDLTPFPNIDPPLNERPPRMLDLQHDNGDREARRRVRPIPTRWAAHAIAWNKIVQVSYDQPAPRKNAPTERARFSSEKSNWDNHGSHERPTSNRDSGWQSMRTR